MQIPHIKLKTLNCIICVNFKHALFPLASRHQKSKADTLNVKLLYVSLKSNRIEDTFKFMIFD